MMHDLIVVGGGFWGSVAAYLSCKMGYDTLLIDSGQTKGASRNAAGIVQWNWYRKGGFASKFFPPWWEESQLGWSKEFLQDSYGLQHTGVTVQKLYGKKDSKMENDFSLLPPPSKSDIFLSSSRVVDSVHKISYILGGWEVRGMNSSYKTRKVVLAAGVWTDRILINSDLPPVGVTGLVGKAALVKVLGNPKSLPVSYALSPYKHYTVRNWENGCQRVGDTVEKKEGEHHWNSLMSYIPKIFDSTKEPEVIGKLEGIRPVCEKFTVNRVARGLVVAVGGHRVGLAVSPIVACRALKLLGLWNEGVVN